MWTKTGNIQGQASWAKMTPPGCKLTALAYHPTKRVNKAQELTYLSTYIEVSSQFEFIADQWVHYIPTWTNDILQILQMSLAPSLQKYLNLPTKNYPTKHAASLPQIFLSFIWDEC